MPLPVDREASALRQAGDGRSLDLDRAQSPPPTRSWNRGVAPAVDGLTPSQSAPSIASDRVRGLRRPTVRHGLYFDQMSCSNQPSVPVRRRWPPTLRVGRSEMSSKIRPDSSFWSSGLFLLGFICIRRRIPKHREWRTVYGPRRDDSNDYVDGTGEAADFPAAGAA